MPKNFFALRKIESHWIKDMNLLVNKIKSTATDLIKLIPIYLLVNR